MDQHRSVYLRKENFHLLSQLHPLHLQVSFLACLLNKYFFMLPFRVMNLCIKLNISFINLERLIPTLDPRANIIDGDWARERGSISLTVDRLHSFEPQLVTISLSHFDEIPLCHFD